MTSPKDTGGPAFPMLYDRRLDPDFVIDEGMTLRDHFAGLAMQAMITKGMESTFYRNEPGVPVISKFAYEYADAMLEARK